MVKDYVSKKIRHCRVQTEGMPISIRFLKKVKITKCLSQLGMENSQNVYLNQVQRKKAKNAKCLSQLGMEKHKEIVILSIKCGPAGPLLV